MNIKKFWKDVIAQDKKEIRKYFHKEAYVNWHCTNEHFTVDEYITANCEYPGEWDGIIERIEIVYDLIITVVLILSKNVFPKFFYIHISPPNSNLSLSSYPYYYSSSYLS